MDEELIYEIIEEEISLAGSQEVDAKVETVEAETADVGATEVEEIATIDVPEAIEITIEDGVGYVAGRSGLHSTLPDRNNSDQHVIEAITGLREELDSINTVKTPQTLYSDDPNVATYYKWANGSYDTYGYFVSVVDGDKIQICNGTDIFGVVVDTAGFVGNQTVAPRDNSYGLVVTSGLVDVRCELNVEVGDFIVSNSSGYAKKSALNYGYKVLGTAIKHGVNYAVIALGVQADVMNTLGADLNVTKEQVDANYNNIISAVNVANQAYNKSTEATTVAKEALLDALKALENSEDSVEIVRDALDAAQSASSVATQAQAIANSAATSAEAMRNEAVEKANDAWLDVNNLMKTLEPITTWEDPETGIKGADYLATQMTNGIATSYDVKAVEDELEIAQSAIIRSGKELQSLMTVIDKYSVGPHSQAYGFTLEQAASVLEEGMIYVPTENVIEIYEYVGADGEIQTYERSFVPGFLYKWGKLTDYPYGWITVDKDYVETDETNTSSKAVYFTATEPTVSGNFGYWYTDGDTITSTTCTYDPYTLYKWEKPEGEDGYWFAVATLAGNSSNRAVSQIRQDANSIAFEVTNPKGSFAGMKAELDDVSAKVHSITAWPSDVGKNKYNMAILKQHSDGNSAHMALAAIRNVSEDADNPEYKFDELDGATIVLSDDEQFGSYIKMDADRIDFTTGDFEIDASHIINLEAPEINLDGYVTFTNLQENNGETFINGANIITDTITADHINVDNLAAISADLGTLTAGTIDASQVTVTNLDASQITTGTLDAALINVDELSAISANLGTVTSGEIQSPNYEKKYTWSRPGSEGLGYTTSADGTYYIVKSRGACTDTDVVIPNSYNGLPVKEIGQEAFNSDKTLMSIVISDSVNSIGLKAFRHCTNLKSIRLGESVTSIGEEAFQNCTSLTSITIPSSTTSIGEYAFYGCSSLTSITIPSSVTFLGTYAFGFCSRLTSVIIPDSLTTISTYTFYRCTSLTSITIPDSVTSIEHSAFYDCTSLTSVTIGNRVTSISAYAFFNCTGITTVYYKGTASNWNNISIGYNPTLTDATRYYYSATQPSDNGNYWCDSTDGFKISCNDTNMIDSKYFKVDQSGRVSASEANITGTINANNGNIGQLQISGGGLSSYDGNNQALYSLNSSGLVLAKNTANIKVGDLSLGYNANEKNTIIETTGHLVIRGANATQLEFMKDAGTTSASSGITLHYQATNFYSASTYANLWISSSQAPLYPVTVYVVWQNGYQTDSGTVPLTISAGSTTSSKTEINITNTSSNRKVRFSTDGVSWTGFVGSNNDTSAYSFASFSSFSHTASPNNLYITGNLLPSNNTYNLGGSGTNQFWNNIYCNTSAIDLSDRDQKNNITALSAEYEQIFDSLKPVSYKFNVNDSGRTHTGLIAQDVKEAVTNAGLTTKEFSGYCEWANDDGSVGCGLRYGEFISLCIDQIQKLKARTTELEEKNAKLEERLSKIEALLSTT